MQRSRELAELSASYGEPLLQHLTREVTETTFQFWSAKSKRRFGEVVLFILRPNGKVLLHTKAFYPEGVFRAPSGTIKRGESLLEAVHRETQEETGLRVRIERFLAVFEFEFSCRGQSLLIPSYPFLVRETQGVLHCEDGHEQISAFREVSPGELESVGEQLDQLMAEWQDWGWFRSIPHRTAARLLAPRVKQAQ